MGICPYVCVPLLLKRCRFEHEQIANNNSNIHANNLGRSCHKVRNNSRKSCQLFCVDLESSQIPNFSGIALKAILHSE